MKVTFGICHRPDFELVWAEWAIKTKTFGLIASVFDAVGSATATGVLEFRVSAHVISRCKATSSFVFLDATRNL